MDKMGCLPSTGAGLRNQPSTVWREHLLCSEVNTGSGNRKVSQAAIWRNGWWRVGKEFYGNKQDSEINWCKEIGQVMECCIQSIWWFLLPSFPMRLWTLKFVIYTRTIGSSNDLTLQQLVIYSNVVPTRIIRAILVPPLWIILSRGYI